MIKKLVKFVFAALILMISTAAAQPTATSLGVNSTSGDPNTFVLVPVNITNVINGPLASVIFNINFNPSVLSLTAVTKGDLTSAWDAPNYNAAIGKLSIVTANTSVAIQNGSTGSVILLNFSVVGAAGTTSAIGISGIQLSDLNGSTSLTGTSAKNGTFTVNGTLIAPPTLTLALNTTLDNVTVANATVNNFTSAVLLNKTGVQVATATLPDTMTAKFNLTGISPGFYFIEVNGLSGDRVPTFIDTNTASINQSVGKRLVNSIIGNSSNPTNYRIKARSGGRHPVVNYFTGVNESKLPFVIVYNTSVQMVEVRVVNTSELLTNFTPTAQSATIHQSVPGATGAIFQTWQLGPNNHGIAYNGTDTLCTTCHVNMSIKPANYTDVGTGFAGAGSGWCYKCHYGKTGDGSGYVDPKQTVNSVALTTSIAVNTTINNNATYTLTVTNTGNSIDSYNLTLQAPANATASLSAPSVGPLNAGANTTVQLYVKSSMVGSYVVNVTATSLGNASVNATVTTNTTVVTPIFTNIVVSPQLPAVTVNSIVNFTAAPQDQFGNPMTGIVVTWNSSNTTVGNITSTGNLTASFTANATGTSIITATSGSVSGNTTVTVSQQGVQPQLIITASPTKVLVGTPTNVLFTVTNATTGSPINNSMVNLSGVVTISGNTTNGSGQVIISVNAPTAGTITATASASGYTSNTTTITAQSPITQLTITASRTAVYVNQLVNVVFTVTDANGVAVRSANVALSGSGTSGNGTTNDAGVVALSVNASTAGTITATAGIPSGSGSTNITAMASPSSTTNNATYFGYVTVNGTASLVNITNTTTGALLASVPIINGLYSGVVQVTAGSNINFNVNNVIAATRTVLNTDISSTIRVDLTTVSYGVLTPANLANSTFVNQPATYTIPVTNNGTVTDTFNLAIQQPLPANVTAASLSPNAITLAQGQTGNVSFSITASVPNTYVVNVTATSVNNASATDITMTTTTVFPIVNGVSLTSSNATNTTTINNNAIYVLTVTNTGNFTDNYNLTLQVPANATASLSATSVGPLNAGANNTTVQLYVTSSMVGSYVVNVTATSQGNSSVNATVTTNTTVVTPILTSILVSPQSPAVTVNSTVNFTAAPQDQFGYPMTGIVVTWNSSNTTVGNITQTGVFTANATGTSIITATNGNVSGNATITVADLVMTVQPGWNLVSVPFNLANQTPFAGMEVRYYNASLQQVIPDPLGLGVNLNVHPLKSYWVNNSAGVNVLVPLLRNTSTPAVGGGGVPSRSIPLASGWNMIGYTGNNLTTPAKNMLDPSLLGGYGVVADFNMTSNSYTFYYVTGTPPVSALKMRQTAGYWVFATRSDLRYAGDFSIV